MRKITITAITVLALTQPVQANLITFTSETAFSAAIGGVTLATEGFEAIDLDANPGPLNLGNVSVNTEINTVYGNNDQRYVSEGARAIDWAQFNDGEITFAFNSPINAFAIDIKDLGTLIDTDDNAIPATLSVSVSGSAFLPILTNITGEDGNLLFVGLFDATTPFSDVTFAINTEAENDFVGFDRLQYGLVAIPEPGGLTLLLSGLIGLVLLRRFV